MPCVLPYKAIFQHSGEDIAFLLTSLIEDEIDV